MCVPAGTRNHFALDLGVDRDDVVGALDAYVKGGERVVDLAEVNGRVFVNNVSLGVYAEAVQSQAYRDAKLRTLVDTMPEVLGPQGEGLDLTGWAPMGRAGRPTRSCWYPMIPTGWAGRWAPVPAREWTPGSSASRWSTRNGGARRIQQWTTDSFEIESAHTVAAGIDGEAVRLDPPLRFRSRPGALRVRIAPQHPGASPSAAISSEAWKAILVLARVAATDPRSSVGAAADEGAGGLPDDADSGLTGDGSGAAPLDRGGEPDASAPPFRYFVVLVMMLVAVVFLIAAPTANWSRAVGLGGGRTGAVGRHLAGAAVGASPSGGWLSPCSSRRA